jgi:hypothetical protein
VDVSDSEKLEPSLRSLLGRDDFEREQS